MNESSTDREWRIVLRRLPAFVLLPLVLACEPDVPRDEPSVTVDAVTPADGCAGDACADAEAPACPNGFYLAERDRCVQCLADGDCASGVCHPTKRQCVACYLDRHCDAGVCDVASSFCVECLGDADCASGVCDVADRVCVGCGADADCDDGNPCTADRCLESGCASTPAGDGVVCDDGDPCTAGEVCEGSACVSSGSICEPCTGSDQCGDGFLCRFEADCGGEGECVPVPESCGGVSIAPVCGCDGEDYSSACRALRAGVAVRHAGECCAEIGCEATEVAVDSDADGCPDTCACQPVACPGGDAADTDGDGCGDTCPCSHGAPCPAGQYCEVTGCNQAGLCALASGCSDGSGGPVCGCDGLTWPSKCAAAKAGVVVAKGGACCPVLECKGGQAVDTDSDGCLDTCPCETTSQCGVGQRCAVEVCGGSGRCVACAAEKQAVCGCDGKTYTSACDAPSGIKAMGACCAAFDCFAGTPIDTDGDGCNDACGCEGATCGSGQACAPKSCGGPKVCVPCLADTGPVCGCDGATWASACEAGKAGVGVQHAGACKCSAGTDCATGQLCDVVACGGSGTCQPCEVNSGPVCSCSGVTAESTCALADMGLSLDHVGVCCDEKPLECPPWQKPADTNLDGCPNTCVARSCKSTAECGSGGFCKVPTGACGGVSGLCQAVPATGCPSDAPVCGCDGVTYESACAAALAGQGVAKAGACCVPPACEANEAAKDTDGDGCADTCVTSCVVPACGSHEVPEDTDGDGCADTCVKKPCQTAAECGAGAFCQRAIGQCSGEGVCVSSEDTPCEVSTGPVCSCAGKTYETACDAWAVGDGVESTGACPCEPVDFECKPGFALTDTDNDGCPDACRPIACESTDECGDPTAAYCALPEGECGGKGKCALLPDECDGGASPVCACNGKSYANACEASAAGQSVAYDGKCTCGVTCQGEQVAVDVDGDGCADTCGENCETSCDCYALGDAAASICSEDCTDCEPGWKCAEGACIAACATSGSAAGCQKTCKTNDECADDAYCARKAGECGTQGTCSPRPTTCTGVPSATLVCACDGTEYENACLAAQKGTNVATEGSCQ